MEGALRLNLVIVLVILLVGGAATSNSEKRQHASTPAGGLSASTGDAVDGASARLVPLTVLVGDEDGVPAARSVVEWFARGGKESGSATTDREGLARLAVPEGRVRLQVLDEEGSEIDDRRSTRLLEIRRGATIPPISLLRPSREEQLLFRLAARDAAPPLPRPSDPTPRSSRLSWRETSAGALPGDAPRGADGELTGTVLDPRGEPVHGAWVRALGPISIVDGAFSARGEACVSSDSDGSFTFEGLPPGEYELDAGDERARYGMAAGFVSTDATHAPLVLTGGGSIDARVVDASTGEPLRRFDVAVRRRWQTLADSLVTLPVADPDGRFSWDELPYDIAALVITAPGMIGVELEPTFTVESPGTGRTVALDPLPPLSLHVRPRGFPDGLRAAISWILSGTSIRVPVGSCEVGERFRFDRWIPGAIGVEVCWAGSKKHHLLLTPGGEPREISFPLEPVAIIGGQVLDGGTPVPFARILAREGIPRDGILVNRGLPRSDLIRHGFQTDRDGRFEVPLDPTRGLSYSITVGETLEPLPSQVEGALRMVTWTRPLTSTGDPELELRMPVGTLGPSVRAEFDIAPQKGVGPRRTATHLAISMRSIDQEPMIELEAESDGQRCDAPRRLPPGSYDIETRVEVGECEFHYVERLELSETAGDRVIRGGTGRILGRVHSKDPGMLLAGRPVAIIPSRRVEHSDGPSLRHIVTTLRSDGTFECEGVPPGPYRVRVGHWSVPGPLAISVVTAIVDGTEPTEVEVELEEGVRRESPSRYDPLIAPGFR